MLNSKRHRSISLPVALGACVVLAPAAGNSYSQNASPLAGSTEERMRRLEEAVKALQEENTQLRRLVTNAPARVPPAPAPVSAPPAVGSAAPAENAGEQSKLWGDKDVRFFWKDGLNFQSGDGKTFKGKIGGRLQYDFAGFDESDAVRSLVGNTPFSTEFRRARLYTSGEINQGVSVYYILQMEFAGGDTRFADAYIGVREIPCLGSLQVGQMYEPISLEQLTSDNYVTFLERALPIEAFSPARNVGGLIQNQLFQKRMTYAFGVFADDKTDHANEVPFESNVRFTGRLTGLPWYDEESGGRRYLHLGAGGSIVNPEDDQVQYRSRPEAHLAPRYVDTGVFPADMAYVANSEVLFTYDRLSLQGEYFHNWADASASSDPQFEGFYVFASYFLTADYRPYNKSSGTLDRVKPKQNFSLTGGGLGALELLARISQLDLNGGTVRGGRLTDYTAGLCWYLNPNTRVNFNYTYADLDRNGVSGGSHIFQLRTQVDF